MIRLAFASVADTAIIPLQDILGLDSRARMNMPGTGGGKLALAVPERADRRNNARPARGADCHLQPVEWNGSRRQGTAVGTSKRPDAAGPTVEPVLSKRAQTPP